MTPPGIFRDDYFNAPNWEAVTEHFLGKGFSIQPPSLEPAEEVVLTPDEEEIFPELED